MWTSFVPAAVWPQEDQQPILTVNQGNLSATALPMLYLEMLISWDLEISTGRFTNSETECMICSTFSLCFYFVSRETLSLNYLIAHTIEGPNLGGRSPATWPPAIKHLWIHSVLWNNELYECWCIILCLGKHILKIINFFINPFNKWIQPIWVI